MFWGSILALIAGGLIGWWWGRTHSRNAVNRQWMSALESAKVDGIIDEDQRSTIIRMQGSQR
jgi:hypothetical protein